MDYDPSAVNRLGPDAQWLTDHPSWWECEHGHRTDSALHVAHRGKMIDYCPKCVVKALGTTGRARHVMT